MFRPEFLNRIDELLVFQALSNVQLTKIVGTHGIWEIVAAEPVLSPSQGNRIQMEKAQTHQQKHA